MAFSRFSRFFDGRRKKAVKEIINDSTDGLTFYSQPAMTVDAADLKQLYPMVKTPQWFQSYQETMGNHGCKETIFQDPIENVELVALTLALNYGKFRRYVTREEVSEWANNFHIEALKEAKANLKGRIAEIGNIKKAWEKPVQGTSLYRAKLPDELSASMICLPETVKKLKVKGDHVAMLPVASVLYVTGSKDDDGLKLMCDLALDYLNYPHFLTLQPIRLAGKNEVPGKGYHWTLFENAIVESKMASASVNLFVSPQTGKKEDVNQTKAKPASFFSALSSKIQAGLRSPRKSKKLPSAAAGAASSPTPVNDDDFNEDSVLSNGHDMMDVSHDGESIATNAEEDSVNSVITVNINAVNPVIVNAVNAAVVNDEEGTKEAAGSGAQIAIDGPLEGSLNKSGGSFDSFVHVDMSDVVADDDAAVREEEDVRPKGEKKREAEKEREKEIKKDEKAAVEEEDSGFVAHEIVPNEVQMQLLASVIDGEDIVMKANVALQQSKAPTKATSPGATVVAAAAAAAATEPVVAATTEATVVATDEELDGRNVSFEEQNAVEKKIDFNKKASQKKSKNSTAVNPAAPSAVVAAAVVPTVEVTVPKLEKKRSPVAVAPQKEKDATSAATDAATAAATAASSVFAPGGAKEGARGEKKKEKTPPKKEEHRERKKSDGGERGRGCGKKDGDDQRRSSGGGEGGTGGRGSGGDGGRGGSGGGSGAAAAVPQAERFLGLCETDVWLEKPRYEAAEAELAQALARIAAQNRPVAQSSAAEQTTTTKSATSEKGGEKLLDRPTFEEALDLGAKRTSSAATAPAEVAHLAMETIWFDQSKYEEAYNVYAFSAAGGEITQRPERQQQQQRQPQQRPQQVTPARAMEEQSDSSLPSGGLPYPFYVGAPRTTESVAPTATTTTSSKSASLAASSSSSNSRLAAQRDGAAKELIAQRHLFLRGLAQENVWFEAPRYHDAEVKLVVGGDDRSVGRTGSLEASFAPTLSPEARWSRETVWVGQGDHERAEAAFHVAAASEYVAAKSKPSVDAEANEEKTSSRKGKTPVTFREAPAHEGRKEDGEEEEDAFDFFTPVPIGSAAREAEKIQGGIVVEEEEEEDAFDFFTVVPLGSAARDAEKAQAALEAEIAAKEAEEDEEIDAFDLFTAVPLGSAAREAEKAAEEAAAAATIVEVDDEEIDAFDLFTAVPLGSAAREAEKAAAEAAAAPNDDAEGIDAFDLFTAVPLGSAAREAEKAAEEAAAAAAAVEEDGEDIDAFDLFTAVPLGSAAREAEKAAEATKALVAYDDDDDDDDDEEEMDAFDLFTAVPLGSAARDAEKAAEAAAAAAAAVVVEEDEEVDAFDLFTAVPLGSAAREAEKAAEAAATIAEDEEVDAFDLFTAVPLGSAAREAEKAAELEAAAAAQVEEEEVDAFDLFTAVPLGSAAREAEIEEEKKKNQSAAEQKQKEEDASALAGARQAAVDAQKAIWEAKEILAQAQRDSQLHSAAPPVSYAAAAAATSSGVFAAEPVSASAFNAATVKAKSPAPVAASSRTGGGNKRESLPSQETFTFHANGPASAAAEKVEDGSQQRHANGEGKISHQRKSSKEKSPQKPKKNSKDEGSPSQDGDAPQTRKRKANSQMHKLGVTPPPPAAPTGGNVAGDVGSQLPTASISNGFHAGAASTTDHATTKDAAAAAAASAAAATANGVVTAALPKAEAKMPAGSAATHDVKCASEKLFGDGPIVLNERTLRLLGLSESGWNSLLLKSRLSGGVLPLETTFICFECGRDAVAEKKRLMKCKRCKVASYCDTNCQGVNWAAHKRVCKVVGNHQHAEEIHDQSIFCQ